MLSAIFLADLFGKTAGLKLCHVTEKMSVTFQRTQVEILAGSQLLFFKYLECLNKV